MKSNILSQLNGVNENGGHERREEILPHRNYDDSRRILERYSLEVTWGKMLAITTSTPWKQSSWLAQLGQSKKWNTWWLGEGGSKRLLLITKDSKLWQ